MYLSLQDSPAAAESEGASSDGNEGDAFRTAPFPAFPVPVQDTSPSSGSADASEEHEPLSSSDGAPEDPASVKFVTDDD